MTFSDDDYIQLSSIQHYVFCPRQCGLIHVEGIWEENRLTARGKILHEKVDSGEDETLGDKSITRGLYVYSKRLGLSGRADVVEFGETGEKILPYPVEYKAGKPKNDISDMAQLCAQALCLEEMLGVTVREAAIFYGKPRKRFIVDLTDDLRRDTEGIILKIHRMIAEREVPKGRYSPKCKSCSLIDQCMPGTADRKVKNYIWRLYEPYEEAP